MPTMTDITALVKEYSDHRKILRERVDKLEEETAALKRRLLPGIRSAVELAKGTQAKLTSLIDERRDLFEKPRTQTLFGIRFGIQKQKGKLAWADKDSVVKLVKKMFPMSWSTYIKITETPKKAALSTLSIVDLKKLSIEVEETGDEVFIEPTDAKVDKFVEALLREKTESEDETD
jgi:hypothetical protein